MFSENCDQGTAMKTGQNKKLFSFLRQDIFHSVIAFALPIQFGAGLNKGSIVFNRIHTTSLDQLAQNHGSGSGGRAFNNSRSALPLEGICQRFINRGYEHAGL